jgi:hypothetical protein
MRVYLCFLERSQNTLSLLYCAFFLILYQSQSAEFCEIVVAENRIRVSVLLPSWFIFGVFICCLHSMDEMLIRFSLVFDRWMTTPTPPLEPTDGSVVTGCTAPSFLPCFGTCCTASATLVFPRTVAVCTVSSGWGAARSMWTFRLTPPTRP